MVRYAPNNPVRRAMRALRGKIMKYGKRIAAALLAAALAACLTGCGGTADWASAKPLIQRAREMNSTDKETSVLQDFLKNCKDEEDFLAAAEYYEGCGEQEQAVSILETGIRSLQKRKDNGSEELVEDYFSLLAKQGKLEAVRQNAPDLSSIPVNGKPFSKYDRESLLALIPSENIGYVNDNPSDDYYYYDASFRNVDVNVNGSTSSSYPYYSINFYNLASGRGTGKGTGPEPVLPAPFSLTGTYTEYLQALGFTDDQIDLLQDYSSVTVFLQERDMEMYVYSYSPAEEYRYFRLNYSLRAYDGSIGFNFNEKGLDSYELSWNS